jgi:integrase
VTPKVAPAEPVAPCATVLEVCRAYLAKAREQNGENKTFKDRLESLFDFCFGLPARFRTKQGEPNGKQTRADRVHGGYGEWPVCQLKQLDLDQWLQAHSGWLSSATKRTHLKAIITALNYGVKAGMIPLNPVRGFKVPKMNGRTTYLKPEQEAALCEAAGPELAMAIRVLIRTGMRPGIEFAALAARHVNDEGERMQIVFPASETKTKKRPRVIYVVDREIIAILRNQVALNPSGPIFQSHRKTAWKQDNLSKRFREVRDGLAKLFKDKDGKEGMEFDRDCVLYSTRHTYAKRILSGYWGTPTNIETLARLMGNSPAICRAHYLQWDETSTEFLWQSA